MSRPFGDPPEGRTEPTTDGGEPTTDGKPTADGKPSAEGPEGKPTPDEGGEEEPKEPLNQFSREVREALDDLKIRPGGGKK